MRLPLLVGYGQACPATLKPAKTSPGAFLCHTRGKVRLEIVQN